MKSVAPRYRIGAGVVADTRINRYTKKIARIFRWGRNLQAERCERRLAGLQFMQLVGIDPHPRRRHQLPPGCQRATGQIRHQHRYDPEQDVPYSMVARC